MTELFFTFIFPAIYTGCEMQWGDFIRLKKEEKDQVIIFHNKKNSGHAFLSVMKFTTCTDGLEQPTCLELSIQGLG